MYDSFLLLKNKFESIKNKGWIKSLRRGSTGVGYTFESLLGKDEDSYSLPDFNGIEIKLIEKTVIHILLFLITILLELVPMN